MERTRFILTSLGAGLLVFAASAQPGGRQPGGELPTHPLLEQVRKAADSVKLAGVREVVMVRANGGPSRFRERVLQDGAKIRIEYSAGGPFEGQIIVDNGVVQHHFVPEKNEIRERPSFGQPWMMFGRRATTGGPPRGQRPSGDRPSGERRPATGGPGWVSEIVQEPRSQKVAGITTTVLSFNGRDKRVFSRMWIEPRRKAVLKSQVYDPAGKVVGGFEYVAVKFDPVIPSGAFVLNVPGAKRIQLEDEAEKAFKETKLPYFGFEKGSGWKLTSVRKMSGERLKFVALTYSRDGKRVTLFITPEGVDRARLEQMAGGRTKVYTWKDDGVNLVLMGGMDETVLKQLSRLIDADKARSRHL
jgi:hypothetical protein